MPTAMRWRSKANAGCGATTCPGATRGGGVTGAAGGGGGRRALRAGEVVSAAGGFAFRSAARSPGGAAPATPAVTEDVARALVRDVLGHIGHATEVVAPTLHVIG